VSVVDKKKIKNARRIRRSYRVSNSIRGSADRPRLAVYRSHKHIACQVIDDSTGATLASASTRDKDLRGDVKYGGNKAAAEAIGKAVAERAIKAGVKAVKFDRSLYKYHGRVAALAEAARQSGLSF
jgi:large subunit ribosomal protein L18